MVTIFFSYSHRDESMRDELEVHLSMLQRQQIVETYRNGEGITECCIRVNSPFQKGIAYSYDATGDNSYNELLSVEDDGHTLLLHPMMSFGDRENLSQHGAAEYLWALLIRPLQERD